ncbi:serine/threonine-protein kinase [Myxococcota bacterium]
MQSRNLFPQGSVLAGRYRILSPLSLGGHGVLCFAEETNTARRVTLKLLWPQMLSVPGAFDNCVLEARNAARMNSQHVVQVLDAGVDESRGVPFLVIERLVGTDFRTLVSQTGPLGSEHTVQYLGQAAQGLDGAHACVDSAGRPAPIVHQALKPDNLFLTQREDGSPLVKILDFGIAKALSQTADLSTESRDTPHFMAAEQLSRRPVTPATDLWALGLIAFYFLAGRNYWTTTQDKDDSWPRLSAEVLSRPIVPPSARAREFGGRVVLPNAFDEWFVLCVNRDPARRFLTAGAAVVALAAALSSALASTQVIPRR